jgi:serine/threonine protein kinase
LQALALTLLRDIAAGMNYLHSRSVIHGDLKPGGMLGCMFDIYLLIVVTV